jgi:hypothetical protein
MSELVEVLQRPGDTVALDRVDLGPRFLYCGHDGAEVLNKPRRDVRGGDVGPWHAKHARSGVENGSSLDLIAAYFGVFVETDPAALRGQRDRVDIGDLLCLDFAVVFTHCGQDESGLP